MRTKKLRTIIKIVRKFHNSLIVSVCCGKTGIRTLGTRKGTTVFETVPIDRSGIFPSVVGVGGETLSVVLLGKVRHFFLHGKIFFEIFSAPFFRAAFMCRRFGKIKKMV